jgi:hypothetical protein
MVQVERDDLLRALKGFKGIAKQDLLLIEQTPQMEYRKTHAEARREIYTKLIDLVECSGITEACVFAMAEYHKVPEFIDEDDPALNGHLQALELFFKLIGVTPDKFKTLRESNEDINQLFALIPPTQGNAYA